MKGNLDLGVSDLLRWASWTYYRSTSNSWL